MEKQFNQHREAVKHTYVPGQFVLVKYYHNGKEKWIQGRSLCRSGNVTYDVDIETTVWVQDTNQLQSSHLPETKSNFLTARYPIGHFQTASSMFPRYTKG